MQMLCVYSLTVWPGAQFVNMARTSFIGVWPNDDIYAAAANCLVSDTGALSCGVISSSVFSTI
jgi:hypothetical protein